MRRLAVGLRTRRPAGRRLRFLALAVILATGACDHPIAVVTPHLEAADVVLRTPQGEEVARTLDNRSWRGSGPTLAVGDSVPLQVRFLDFRGNEIDLTGRSDLQVRLEFDDPAAGLWEPLSDGGRLFAFAPGPQRLRVLVRHLDHVDFVTPWLAVEVAQTSSLSRSEGVR